MQILGNSLIFLVGLLKSDCFKVFYEDEKENTIVNYCPFVFMLIFSFFCEIISC